jgi:hypothetical protein
LRKYFICLCFLLVGLIISSSSYSSQINKNINIDKKIKIRKEEKYHEDSIKLEARIPINYYIVLQNECKEKQVPIFIASRLMYRESRFKPFAVGKNYNSSGKIISYDKGLGQINSNNVEDLKWRYNNNQEVNLFDPFINIHLTVCILAWAYEQTGNWFEALLIYNAGYGNWKRGTIKQKTLDYAYDILYNPHLYDDYINYSQEYISVNKHQ